MGVSEKTDNIDIDSLIDSIERLVVRKNISGGSQKKFFGTVSIAIQFGKALRITREDTRKIN